ncbi:uncharacterized protein LOC116188887 [Punica granatum]|uniref:Uncharacterized protein LOC116188887 n=1 Tax=Punica granatum TaxID=22663 RepID=A0A6P8BV67_PUNGR|nr:uncharacterized protein LOC116188887 [Punica granatum]
MAVVYASDIPVLKEVEAVMDPATLCAVHFVILGYLVEALGLLKSDAGRASSISLFTVGDFLNFLSAIFFAIHMLRTEHFSRCTKKETFLALLGYEISVAAVLSTLWHLIGGWFSGVQDFERSSWTGGSSTVQVFGSSTPKKEVENDETNNSIQFLSAVEKQKLKNGLSASPPVVRSREDVKDIL